MNKKTIRLTESNLHRIVKESVKRVLREAHVIDKQFGQSKFPGGFESAIVNAWSQASSGNKRKLEDAFPEFFPREEMYGNEDEPFDFREFPYRKAYDEFYKGWQERHHKM